MQVRREPEQVHQSQAAGVGHSNRRVAILLVSRVLVVALATAAAWLIVRSWDDTASFPPTPALSSLSLLPVNLICLY